MRALDVVPAKVDMVNRGESPIRDAEIERFLAEREGRGLSLATTIDPAEAYVGAEYVVVATPTNYARSATSSTPQLWRPRWTR